MPDITWPRAPSQSQLLLGLRCGTFMELPKEGRPANGRVALPWSDTGSHVSPGTLILAGSGGFAAGICAILQGKLAFALVSFL